jgi:hypothetical protein
VWKEHVDALKPVPGQLSVVELCAGAGIGALAFRLLVGEDRVNFVAAYDTDSNCKHHPRRTAVSTLFKHGASEGLKACPLGALRAMH